MKCNILFVFVWINLSIIRLFVIVLLSFGLSAPFFELSCTSVWGWVCVLCGWLGTGRSGEPVLGPLWCRHHGCSPPHSSLTLRRWWWPVQQKCTHLLLKTQIYFGQSELCFASPFHLPFHHDRAHILLVCTRGIGWAAGVRVGSAVSGWRPDQSSSLLLWICWDCSLLEF